MNDNRDKQLIRIGSRVIVKPKIIKPDLASFSHRTSRNSKPCPSGKYRDMKTIIADILRYVKSIKEGVVRTNIMQNCNLNHGQIKFYLDVLVRERMLTVQDWGKNRKVCRITYRGIKWLADFEREKIANK